MSHIEGTHLGKTSTYKTTYDPSLLVAVPRQENRAGIDITNDNLPFVGMDVWNAYEISCLNPDGKPVAGIAKIVYPADSEFLVESKSLKLYLNSFNMEHISWENDTDDNIRTELSNIISKDLSNILKTSVEVSVFAPSRQLTRGSALSLLELIEIDNIPVSPKSYNEDMNIIAWEDVNISTQTERPKMLFYSSDLLRSNCKITKQPDWGTVIIGITSNKKQITESSLLEYIISFRNENHFHEEIAETIYKRLYDILEPTELLVACFYTRRGGIDINPIRASHRYLITEYCKNYTDTNIVSHKFARQ